MRFVCIFFQMCDKFKLLNFGKHHWGKILKMWQEILYRCTENFVLLLVMKEF